MKANKKEQCIQNTLIKHYEKYYGLAYSYVKNENLAVQIMGDAAYKAIYFADRLMKPEQVELWIEKIVRKEAEKR